MSHRMGIDVFNTALDIDDFDNEPRRRDDDDELVLPPGVTRAQFEAYLQRYQHDLSRQSIGERKLHHRNSLGGSRAHKLRPEEVKHKRQYTRAEIQVIVKKARRAMKAATYDFGGSLRRMFQQYDQNHDGRLSHAEFERVVRTKCKLTRDDVSVLISVLDKNRDGSLQYEEFIRLIGAGGGSGGGGRRRRQR